MYPSLLPSSDISSLPNPTTTSPRKLSVQPTNSAASLDSNHANSSPSTSSYWRVPSLDSSDLLHLIARVPIEVPLPPSSTPNTSKVRRLPRTFARAEKAGGSHALVKQALVAVIFDDAGSAGGARHDDGLKKLRKMMERVEEVIKEARERVEAANGDTAA